MKKVRARKRKKNETKWQTQIYDSQKMTSPHIAVEKRPAKVSFKAETIRSEDSLGKNSKKKKK